MIKTLPLFAVAALATGCILGNNDPLVDQAVAVQEALSQAESLEAQLDEQTFYSPAVLRLAQVQGKADFLGGAGMDVEEAVQLIMMMTAMDAHKDLAAMLEEMDETTDAKRAMREHLSQAKEEVSKLKDLIGAEIDKAAAGVTRTQTLSERYRVVVTPESTLVVSFLAFPGQVSVTLSGQSKIEGTIRLIDLDTGETRATASGPLAGISAQQVPQKPTKYAVEVSSSSPLCVCDLSIQFPAPASAPAGLTDVQIRNVVGARAELEKLYGEFQTELQLFARSQGQNPQVPYESIAALSTMAFQMESRSMPDLSYEELTSLTDATRAKLDSMSEMGEMESLRLQMMMDRRSKLISTLSNIMKKISDTQQSITSNLK